MSKIHYKGLVLFMEKMTYKLALTYVLENCELPADVAEKLVAMKASVEKKNGSGSAKTEKQKANEALQTEIVNFLFGRSPMTVQEIFNGMGGEEKFSSHSHANSLVSALKRDGKLIRTEVKGRAYFHVA